MGVDTGPEILQKTRHATITQPNRTNYRCSQNHKVTLEWYYKLCRNQNIQRRVGRNKQHGSISKEQCKRLQDNEKSHTNYIS